MEYCKFDAVSRTLTISEGFRKEMQDMEDMFVNGFRIGVGLLLDAVGSYDSQFVRYHED